MRFSSAILAAAALATASAGLAAGPSIAERGETRLAKATAGRTAGTPVDCINQQDIRSSEIIDRTAILYRTSGNRLYVNRPRSGATSLDSDDNLVTDTHTPQLCSIDVVRLLDRSSRSYSGFVGLGEFVPYVKVADAR